MEGWKRKLFLLPFPFSSQVARASLLVLAQAIEKTACRPDDHS
jgi:hypothetical protein